ncbi:MFS transporter [Erysipelatoclostridium sp. An173]|uniref:MFS transporter n=1 Tax=Erysipelatoclostridium sp. An173 TaxID=1965571 RepID=UPI000B3AADC7|nr:MFS transporter [Erysipelatoclostridium sp. An173]OUP77993.1 MFS transporter [Erysipelatoclostridium sp. An173]
MDSRKSLNIKYMASQIFYFGAFAAMMGYASVYLLHKGFSNSTIGIILSLCSILAVFMQPALASFADNHKNIEIRKIINTIVAIAIILSVALLVITTNQTLIFILIVAIFSLETTIMPLINTLAFIFEKYGIQINFGIARGLGSVAYALTSMALGYIVEWFSPDLLPICYVVFNALLFIVVHLFVLPKNAQIVNADEESETEAEVQENVSLLKFAGKYKKFIVFLLGFVLVYFAHTIINNFFIQIVTNVGGNSSDMGNAVFLAAMLELPTMAYFTKLSQKVNCGTLIKASIVLFLAKHAITYLATNMVMIYIAQVLQMGAYALFIPASVYYVNCKVDNKDIVKGQSFVTTSMTMSGVFANIIGGILLDAVGVSEVLLIGVILSLIGAVIVLFTVEKV